jgi:hypothetical protein
MINLTRTLLAVVAISTATISPVKANVSFLEAALFFLTGVEATNQDIVTDREIILRRYPLVAYLVDGNPCAVRIRNTNNNRLYQMDFCKITGWRLTPEVMQAVTDGLVKTPSVFQETGVRTKITRTQTSPK